MGAKTLSTACVLMLAGAFIAAAATAPTADQANEAEVTGAFSLSNDSPIQYEPVILYYTITNQTARDIKVRFGSSGASVTPSGRTS